MEEKHSRYGRTQISDDSRHYAYSVNSISNVLPHILHGKNSLEQLNIMTQLTALKSHINAVRVEIPTSLANSKRSTAGDNVPWHYLDASC